MRKTLSLTSILLLLTVLIYAQTKEVSGKVTDSAGFPVPGASVIIKGLRTGTSAGLDGTFKLTAPENATLIISGIGYDPVEVNVSGRNSVDVKLKPAEKTMNEVVVTALGIRRNTRELATATQTISSDQLNKSGTGNPLSELNGKASGLTVVNSSGDPGAGTYIRLRGVTSITGNNQPLMVIDGVPIDNSINNYDPTSATPNVSGANANLTGGTQPTNRGVDINPNDIESVTLLKGPAATALYGIQAASGAIIITTKKGSTSRGINVTLASSFTADRVSKLPPRQNLYAQGSKGVYAGPSGGSGRRTTWGPAIDTLYWDGIPNENDIHGNIVGASDPNKKIKVYPYDPYEFFQTGLTYNNNIALSGGTGKSGFRLSLGNVNQTGIIPKTKYDKTTFSLNGQTNITERLNVSGGATYIRSGNDKVQQGSNISSVMLGLLRTPPTFDNSNGLKDAADNPKAYIKPDGTQRNYRGGPGYDNPYWTVNKNPFHEDLQRVIGFGQVNYALADWLIFNYRIGGDVYSQSAKNAYDVQSNAFPAGAIHLLNYNNEQFNSDFTVNLKKDFSNTLTGSLLLGHNYFTTSNHSRLAHGSTFILPGFYDISNILSYSSQQLDSRKRVMAFYGEFRLAVMDQLFLSVTGRQETSSTLPQKNNHFFYPSASVAYEFTKLQGMSGKVLSYGKLRASFAQVGKDAPVQGLQTYFGQTFITDGFTSGDRFPFTPPIVGAGPVGGYQISSTISTIGNPELKAEKTNSYEIGTDLGFIQNRITFNATAYYSKSSDVILIAPIAYSTGFASHLVNAATITNKGLELTLTGSPVKTKNLRWDLTLNWSKNVNKVLSLASGADRVLIAGFQNGEVDAIAGKPFGQIYGSVYVRSDSLSTKNATKGTALLINDNPSDPGYGMPQVGSQNAPIGDINPDWIGSIITGLNFIGFTISGQLDIRHGGDIWNGTRGAMSYFGTSAETANRDQPTTFKGVLGHLDAAGNVVHNENGVEVAGPGPQNNVQTTFSQFYWQNVGSSFIGPAEPSVENASFVRIRQLSVGYELTKQMLNGTHLNALSITFFTNNPFIWTKYKGVDPETSLAGPANGQGLDYFNNPGSKSYGIRLNVGL